MTGWRSQMLQDNARLFADMESALAQSHRAFLANEARGYAEAQAEVDRLHAQVRRRLDPNVIDVEARIVETPRLEGGQ